MDQEIFSAVDQFIGETIVEEDNGLRGAVEAAEATGLPAIQVFAAAGEAAAAAGPPGRREEDP